MSNRTIPLERLPAARPGVDTLITREKFALLLGLTLADLQAALLKHGYMERVRTKRDDYTFCTASTAKGARFFCQVPGKARMKIRLTEGLAELGFLRAGGAK